LDAAGLAAAYAEAAREGGGKHCGHQRVWNWNALALQEFRFRDDTEKARSNLRRAWELVPSQITGRQYGRETGCVEATWLFLLLNDARMDVRSKAAPDRARANLKLNALKAFAAGDSSLLRTAYPDYLYSPAQYRFDYDPELSAFLRDKVEEESARLTPR